MKKFKNEFFYETVIFSCFLLAVEVIFRVYEKFQIVDYAFLRIILSSILLAMICEFFLCFIKKRKVRLGIQAGILFVASCYAFIQIGFQQFLGIYISVGTSSQAGAVTGYIREFLAAYKMEQWIIFLPFILFLISIFEKRKDFESVSKHQLMRTATIGLLIGCYLLTLYLPFMQNPLQLVENKTLFFSPTNSSVAINQYGTTLFAVLDVKQSVFPKYIGGQSPMVEKTVEKKKEIIDNDIWKEIIAEETLSPRNTLNTYFINRNIAKENEYTGYFKGKNLIVIMLESVNNIILDEEYYPNFAKILKHSWYWENNYSPRNACSTGDNEFSGLTSLYPLNTSCTVNTYPENSYFSSFFARFRANGYTAIGAHPFNDTYYPRNVFHKAMGAEMHYDADLLNIAYDPSSMINWPSDVEFMQKISAILTQKEPFMAWLTTISAHMTYDENNSSLNEYLNLFQDTTYSTPVKRYMAKLKITDDALGVLLDELEAKNELKDTVIVMYGDHYPYGLSDKDLQEVVNYDMKEFYERERTPFLIYQSDLEPKVFSEKTFYMNVLPTVVNLFDLDYDSRFYLGEDLFSEDYSGRVVFADGSWEDEVARYNASNAEITYFDEGVTYSDSEIQSINYDIYQKKEMSKLAITINYFEYLDQKIKAAEEKGDKIE